MNNAQQLQEAGKNYNTLFICYLVIVLMKLVGWIPYVNILTAIADIVLMVIIFLTLRKLVPIFQNPAWLQASGMARTLALLNLLAYPILFLIIIAGAATIIPEIMQQAEQAQRAQMAGQPVPPFQMPQSFYGFVAIGVVFGLAFTVISIIFLYKLFSMSAILGNILEVSPLTANANHVKKCLTMLIVSVITMFVLTILLSIVLGPLVGLILIVFVLGYIVLLIYTTVRFLMMLNQTSNELNNAANKALSAEPTAS